MFLGCLFLALALTTLLFFVVGFLIDKTLTSEEIGDKSALFHHILRDGPNDANNSGEKTLNWVVLEKNISSEKLS